MCHFQTPLRPGEQNAGKVVWKQKHIHYLFVLTQGVIYPLGNDLQYGLEFNGCFFCGALFD